MAEISKDNEQIKRLSFTISQNEEQKLNQAASAFKISKEELVRMAVQHWIDNKNWDAVINNENLTSDAFNFKKVVEYVVNKVSELLDAERAGVMLFDEKNKELVLEKPAFGLDNEEEIEEYRIPIDGTGNAINVFLTGVPSISNDTPSDPRYLTQFVLKYGAKNTVTVPLEVNSRRIGVLHVDNKKTGDFTQKDVELLSLLSSHLALLLENANYFKKEKEQSEQLKKINVDLDNQQKRLRKLMDIHGKLIRKVLYGEGLHAVTMTLAKLLKCTVIVEDNHLNVICSVQSKNNFQEPHPHELLKTINGIYPLQKKLRDIFTKREPQLIPAYPEKGVNYARFIVPLTDKSGILGFLSVLLYGKELDEMDMVAIEQAALVAALELVKEKNAYEIETALKGEFLDLLLLGNFKKEEEIIERAKFLNYDYTKPHSVNIVRLQSQNEESNVPMQKPYNSLVFLIKQNFPQSILRTRGNEIILLTAESEQEVIAGKLNNIRLEIERKYPALTILAGVGKLFPEILRIKESFQQAKRVLDVITAFPVAGKIVSYDQLGIYKLLYDVKDRKKLCNYAVEKIGPLIEYDKKRNIFLITLETFIDNNCVLKEAARKLFIHEKTMEYRMKRIKEILQINKFDTNACMELNMAIKIYRIYLQGQISNNI